MLFVALLSAVLFQQPRPQIPSPERVVAMAGHRYSLSCSRGGEEMSCDSMGASAVEHFALHEETGRVLFERDAPTGKPYAKVQLGGMEIIMEIQAFASESPEGSIAYFFEATRSGVIPFDPVLTCPKGRLQLNGFTTLTVSCWFDSRYFRFDVNLFFDLEQHQIVLPPSYTVFSASLGNDP